VDVDGIEDEETFEDFISIRLVSLHEEEEEEEETAAAAALSVASKEDVE